MAGNRYDWGMIQTPYYCDVHTHLTHEKFGGDPAPYIDRALAAGLGAIIVNGLEPKSNREILAMAQSYPVVKPALGIYPIDGVNDLIPGDFSWPVPRFDVDAEVAFIDSQAAAGRLVAIGECGLDGHWLKEDTFAAQERVLHLLIDVALKWDLPLIVHTRNLEQRSIELLRDRGVKRVNFHCFGGRVGWAVQAAKDLGFWFSIPANAVVNQAFQKMMRELPEDKILTETDAPFLAPKRGGLNEPANVVGTVALLAKIRGWSDSEAKAKVWNNCQTLFRF